MSEKILATPASEDLSPKKENSYDDKTPSDEDDSVAVWINWAVVEDMEDLMDCPAGKLTENEFIRLGKAFDMTPHFPKPNQRQLRGWGKIISVYKSNSTLMVQPTTKRYPTKYDCKVRMMTMILEDILRRYHDPIEMTEPKKRNMSGEQDEQLPKKKPRRDSSVKSRLGKRSQDYSPPRTRSSTRPRRSARQAAKSRSRSRSRQDRPARISKKILFPTAAATKSSNNGEKPRQSRSSTAMSPLKGEKSKSSKSSSAKSPIRRKESKKPSPIRDPSLVIDNDVVFVDDEPTTSRGVPAEKTFKGNTDRAPSLLIEKEVSLTPEESAALKRAEKAEKKSKLAEGFRSLKKKLEKSLEREKVVFSHCMKKHIPIIVFSGEQEAMGLTEHVLQLFYEVRACLDLINNIKNFISHALFFIIFTLPLFQANFVSSYNEQPQAVDNSLVLYCSLYFNIHSRCDVYLIH